MKKLYILLIMVSILLAGCVKPYSYVAYEGNDIGQDVKEPVYKIMDEVFESLQNQETAVLEQYFYQPPRMTSKEVIL